MGYYAPNVLESHVDNASLQSGHGFQYLLFSVAHYLICCLRRHCPEGFFSLLPVACNIYDVPDAFLFARRTNGPVGSQVNQILY
jgi:hypothetical protein